MKEIIIKQAQMLLVLIGSALLSCGANDQRVAELNARVDSLQAAMARTYRPGLGEFMSGIQVQHAKLWFAGTKANWKLADFEVHEIMEALDDIKTYASDRKETALVGMLDPALDSIRVAISKEDTARFRSAYQLLTQSCNNCHQDTDHGFNVITIPTTVPFSDQEFVPMK